MNILITHVYSNDNKGDAALLCVLIKDIRTYFPAAKVHILTQDIVSPTERFEDNPVTNSLMHYALHRYRSKILKLAYSLFMMSLTLLAAVMHKRFRYQLNMPIHMQAVVDKYLEADLIFAVGGGYLRGKPSFASTIELALLSHPFVMASILNKPTILYPQSIGPFANWAQRFIIKYALKKVLLIFVREKITERLLLNLKVKSPIFVSVDSGFLLETDQKVNLHKLLQIGKNNPIIGVTVRTWLEPSAQESYENNIAKTLDNIIHKYNARVIFIPQVTSVNHGDDDRLASRRVRKKMTQRSKAVVMTKTVDHYEILALYKGLDFIIGTRFHSIIFSLKSMVPAIAIEYEHKTSGIMADLDLLRWVIKIEDVETNQLTKLFDELYDCKMSYISYLKQAIPKYTEQAQQTKDVAFEAASTELHS